MNFHCAHLHRFFPLKKGLSKTHQSSLTLKGGSTSHLGLLPSGKKRKPLLSIVFTTPSVPLVGDRNVALNRFILWLADHQRSTPAAELRFFVRDKPQGHGGVLLMGTQGHGGVLLMGTQGHNAGCGDDNTFYSTFDRIDSGEVPIRAMAEIL